MACRGRAAGLPRKGGWPILRLNIRLRTLAIVQMRPRFAPWRTAGNQCRRPAGHRGRPRMRRRDTLKLIGAAGAAGALGLPLQARAAQKTMVTVVKITGIPWFNLVDKGLVRGAKQFDIDVQMVGPAHVDPAQQVKLVEDLIAKKVDAIGLVPLDVKVLAPVLARAQ